MACFADPIRHSRSHRSQNLQCFRSLASRPPVLGLKCDYDSFVARTRVCPFPLLAGPSRDCGPVDSIPRKSKCCLGFIELTTPAPFWFCLVLCTRTGLSSQRQTFPRIHIRSSTRETSVRSPPHRAQSRALIPGSLRSPRALNPRAHQRARALTRFLRTARLRS
jgi:hypothetical protein